MCELYLLLLSAVFCGLTTAAPSSSALPIVDLGYERHQAIALNESAGFYNFSNIRYAAPPLGNLRFNAPAPPTINRTSVQDGSTGRVCPQAIPAWGAEQTEFIVDLLSGRPFNASAFNNTSSSSIAIDPRTTEDCLFLDLLVPQKVFDAARSGERAFTGVPVLFWIYGGGYTEGEKSAFNGAPFLQTSNNGVIFIAINYRLGALGWLSGPTFQANGTANAGLHDQRFALEWVQKYIHLFGGDKDRVMIFGESAGGGSVMHQITAYGGQRGKVPFQAALPQSPGFLPLVSANAQENTFKEFLALANVSSIQEARQLPSSAVIAANMVQVSRSPVGQFTYNPTVDGSFVPALPGQLLLRGAFDHSLRIMTGHNGDEGLDFTPFFIQGNASAFISTLQGIFPGISPSTLDFVLNTLYPDVLNGSFGYHDEIGRASLAVSEFVFTCNDNYLARAFKNQTFAYKFNIPPALHGQDIPYTFFDGDTSGVENVTVARVMQEFITSFAITGRPSSATWGHAIPEYGPQANIVNLALNNITVQKDDTANPRCQFWQKGLFY